MNCLVHHENEDPNSKERDDYSNLQFDFSEEVQQYYEETENLLKLPPSSSEDNSNKNRSKFATKKKSWIKYLSFLSKFKQSKTSSQKKQLSYSFTWKLKHCPKFGSAKGVACKLASIHEAIRRTASGPLASCFHPTKAEEIEVPYIQLEKLGCHALRREAFGPIYMVT